MKTTTAKIRLALLALALLALAPAASDACCRWGCGWRGGCGWGGGWGYGGGYRSCGWGGGYGYGYGCGWGGCGYRSYGYGGWGFAVLLLLLGGPDCGGMVAPMSAYAIPISPTATVVMNDIIYQDPPLLLSPPRYVIAPRQGQFRQPGIPQRMAPTPAETLPAPMPEPTTSRIEIRVPTADAEVWFSGHKTKMAGLKRTFETPELEKGREYSYEVIVKWTDDAGLAKQDSYKLNVTAGKQAVIAFGAKPGDASSWVASRR